MILADSEVFEAELDAQDNAFSAAPLTLDAMAREYALDEIGEGNWIAAESFQVNGVEITVYLPPERIVL